jgi:predicted amidohydrolase
MSTTNKRLAGPAQVSNAAATKYTVPASTTTILQHIHVFNPSGAAVGFTMSIGTDAAGTRLYDAYSIGAGQQLDMFVRIVLTAAEIVQAFASTTNVLTLTLTGQEITPG